MSATKTDNIYNLQQQGDEESHRKPPFNLKPVMFLMALSGCYNLQDHSRPVSTLFWTYTIIIAVLILSFAVRNFIVLMYYPYQLFSYISLLLLSCMCFANCLVGWKTFSKKYGNYHRAMEGFHQLLDILTENNITIHANSFRRSSIVTLTATILFLIGCIAMQTVSYFILSMTISEDMPRNISAVHQLPSITFPFEDTIVSRIGIFVPIVVLNLPLAVPPCFLILLSRLLSTVFNAFNKHISDTTENSQLSLLTNVDKLRSIHVKLCDITSDLDMDLRYFYGNISLLVLGLGLVVLYILLKFSQPYLVVAILLYYIIVTGAVLVAVSVSAALVHEAAHSPLEILYKMDVRNPNIDHVIQLNLFTLKLSGKAVGFTAYGLLAITKEFILSVIGVFLTYFAVLYTL